MRPHPDAPGPAAHTTVAAPRPAGSAWSGETVRAALLFVALAAVLAYPLTLNLTTSTLPGDPDTDLFVWTLSWNTHALLRHPLSVFDANIYFPHDRTLAFSENLLGSTLLFAPVLWLTGDHLLALNVVALSSAILCGAGAFLLARRLGIGAAGALIGGVIFAFAPSRFLRLGQIHLTTVQWIPFCLAYLHAYLDGGRRRDLRLAVAFFSLQALSTGHGASFLTVAVILLLVYRAATGDPPAPWRRLRDFGITGALLLLPTVLVYLPYRRVQAEWGLRRTLADWPVSAESFLAAPTNVHAYLWSYVPQLGILENARAFLFPGFLPVLLALAAFWWQRSPHDTDRRHSAGERSVAAAAARVLEAGALAALAIGLIVAATGPLRWRIGDVLVFSARDPVRPFLLAVAALGVRVALVRVVPFEPLVTLQRARRRWLDWGVSSRRTPRTFYALLTLACISLAGGPPISVWPYVHELPGLSFIRVPSRFMILAVLGVAMLAGLGFERLARRLTPGARRRATALVVALLAVEFAALPIPGWRPYRVDVPGVDRWLATRPRPFVVAEFPVNTYDDRLQSTYMLHSMAHWQKTVHGHSGFRTHVSAEIYAGLRNFPDALSLRTLTRLGVGYAVVHQGMFDRREWPDVESRLGEFAPWLTLEYEEADGRVYSLRPFHDD